MFFFFHDKYFDYHSNLMINMQTEIVLEIYLISDDYKFTIVQE